MGVLTDVLTLGGSIEQGNAVQREAETAALAEEAAGVTREADRKAKLAQALASQNAAAGAAGIAAFEGSPLSIMQEDVKRAGEATQRDVFQTKLAARTLRARGRIARKQIRTGGMLQFASAVEDRMGKAATGGTGGGGK